MQTRLQPAQDHINSLELSLARAKAVLKKFPDVKFHKDLTVFSSKTVNQEYNGFQFIRKYTGLYVIPYHELEFSFKDKIYKARVQSSPRLNKLVYKTKQKVDDKRVMKFSRLAANLKINNFKEEMIGVCRKKIISYINDNTSFYFDTKHLDPKLKKLLLFI